MRLLQQETKPDILVAVLSCAGHKNPSKHGKVKALSCTMFSDFRKDIAFGKVSRFRPFVLLVNRNWWNEYGALVEIYWQDKADVLRKKEYLPWQTEYNHKFLISITSYETVTFLLQIRNALAKFSFVLVFCFNFPPVRPACFSQHPVIQRLELEFLLSTPNFVIVKKEYLKLQLDKYKYV